MADDIYYKIQKGKIYRVVENDGWTFIHRGPEAREKELSLPELRVRAEHDAKAKYLLERIESIGMTDGIEA